MESTLTLLPGCPKDGVHLSMSTGPTTDAGKVKAAHQTHGIYATALNPEEVEAVTQADDNPGVGGITGHHM